MSASPVDATASGRPRREDEAPLLARFVQRISVIYSHLSAADSLQVRSRTVLRSYEKTRKRGYLGMSTLTPSDRQTLTRLRHRFTTAFQGEISAFRESEEARIARLVFLRFSIGAFGSD